MSLVSNSPAPATSLFAMKERSMNTLPHIASSVYTPRPGAKMFFADAEGFNGILSIPTVCPGVTSAVAYTYGYGDGS